MAQLLKKKNSPAVPSQYPTVVVENVYPLVDGGRYPLKRIVGETLTVYADVYKEGHDDLMALVKWRKKGTYQWQEVPMYFIENDRWMGRFAVTENAMYEYTIEAYAEKYVSWVHELKKKNLPGADLKSELLEGKAIIEKSVQLASGVDRVALNEAVKNVEDALENGNQSKAISASLDSTVQTLMAKYPDRGESYLYRPYFQVMANRPEARFAAWYEFFPRSAGTIEGKSATWDDAINRLDEIEEMGFNVVYFPPIHPIGVTNRKGPNNSLHAGPEDPGCPYAIGNEHGGHKGLEPDLGDFDDFERFRQAAEAKGIEIALDFVTNCSPDHPYIKDHPDWFSLRPDGTIKYAENPPKKYEDVHPLNFYTDDKEGLWLEMLDIFMFWAEKGVRIFRVDNPHTKPVPFWEWVIAAVHETYPDVIFLSEAFTKPKMMKMLAKVGFAQSYTYFTWRNTKEELTSYLTELTQTDMKEYFTGNFFTNTPDILPTILQVGGRPAFVMRAVLATTLSSVYGMYSGFELCENTPVPGKEEYLNSEKYDYKVWDWERLGNIKSLVRQLNQIRKENPALQQYENLRFIHVDNPNIIGYTKMTEDKTNIIVVFVNLDPFNTQSSMVHLPLDEMGVRGDESYLVNDLLTNDHYVWNGYSNYIELSPAPQGRMAHVFRLQSRRMPSGL